jgi:dihydroorotate dehydrogenase (fumarate)
VERQYLELVSAVKQELKIPVAVKVGPYFSSPGYMCKRLVEAGADGLVLFNRFLQPDMDLEELTVLPKLELSTESELRLPVRWIAILRGRVQTSIALTSGIHSPLAMLKAIAAGADVGMIASALYQKGYGFIGTLLSGMQQWMEEKEYESVEQLKGAMSQRNCPDPAAFERGNYMKALTSYTDKTSPLSFTPGDVANR